MRRWRTPLMVSPRHRSMTPRWPWPPTTSRSICSCSARRISSRVTSPKPRTVRTGHRRHAGASRRRPAQDAGRRSRCRYCSSERTSASSATGPWYWPPAPSTTCISTSSALLAAATATASASMRAVLPRRPPAPRRRAAPAARPGRRATTSSRRHLRLAHLDRPLGPERSSTAAGRPAPRSPAAPAADDEPLQRGRGADPRPRPPPHFAGPARSDPLDELLRHQLAVEGDDDRPRRARRGPSTHTGVANVAHVRRFEVKWISGITANESCRLRITWLRTSRLLRAPLAGQRDDDDRRDHGERPGDQPPQPGRDPEVEEALHR